jgi:hypothetical protein
LFHELGVQITVRTFSHHQRSFAINIGLLSPATLPNFPIFTVTVFCCDTGCFTVPVNQRGLTGSPPPRPHLFRLLYIPGRSSFHCTKHKPGSNIKGRKSSKPTVRQSLLLPTNLCILVSTQLLVASYRHTHLVRCSMRASSNRHALPQGIPPPHDPKINPRTQEFGTLTFSDVVGHTGCIDTERRRGVRTKGALFFVFANQTTPVLPVRNECIYIYIYIYLTVDR